MAPSSMSTSSPPPRDTRVLLMKLDSPSSGACLLPKAPILPGGASAPRALCALGSGAARTRRFVGRCSSPTTTMMMVVMMMVVMMMVMMMLVTMMVVMMMMLVMLLMVPCHPCG